MSAEWIAFEIFINIVEVCTVFYLLCSKFQAKYKTPLPTLLLITGNIIYLSLPLFISAWLPPVEIITFILYLTYTLLFINGSIWKKIFWVSLAYALVVFIAILTITMFSFLTGVSTLDIMTKSSGIRLLMMITTKIIHVIVFYALSLNKKKIELTNSPSLIICFITPLISFLAVIIIYYIMINETDYNTPDMLIYVVSISYLFINIINFLLYDRINKEAERNYILMAQYKQYEITEQHNKQIVKTYSDIKKWRHDYTNHMQAVMIFLEKSEIKDSNIYDAINYIQHLDEKIQPSLSIISTGNHIVDAIVSAKLSLATSFDIKFEHNITLPEDLTITDTDLCAVLSNLLDNAIEACRKLENGRYINLEMLIIKTQLNLQISNSTNGDYKKENDKFKTTKQGDLHGIGMGHIRSIVEGYNGIYSITADSNLFTTEISIPLTKKEAVIVN